MITGPYTNDLIGCARCHGDGHGQLEWKPFTYQSTFEDEGRTLHLTHWAICPATGEPILLLQTED